MFCNSLAMNRLPISVIVLLCMCVLVKYLFWLAVWPKFGKETPLSAICLQSFNCGAVASFPLVSWTEGVILSIPDHCLPFYFSITDIDSCIFPISPFRLIGMVGEACLPSNAFFHGCIITLHLSGSMSVCLNIPNFAFVYIDFMISWNTIFSSPVRKYRELLLSSWRRRQRWRWHGITFYS